MGLYKATQLGQPSNLKTSSQTPKYTIADGTARRTCGVRPPSRDASPPSCQVSRTQWIRLLYLDVPSPIGACRGRVRTTWSGQRSARETKPSLNRSSYLTRICHERSHKLGQPGSRTDAEPDLILVGVRRLSPCHGYLQLLIQCKGEWSRLHPEERHSTHGRVQKLPLAAEPGQHNPNCSCNALEHLRPATCPAASVSSPARWGLWQSQSTRRRPRRRWRRRLENLGPNAMCRVPSARSCHTQRT